ncbi:MAG TPA: hypothetical protein DEA50_13145 [Parvularcula sp.]|nr:hypothetical protein [Parvularcula sp.]
MRSRGQRVFRLKDALRRSPTRTELSALSTSALRMPIDIASRASGSDRASGAPPPMSVASVRK